MFLTAKNQGRKVKQGKEKTNQLPQVPRDSERNPGSSWRKSGVLHCNLNGRENDERTQVDTNTNKITPGLNGA